MSEIRIASRYAKSLIKLSSDQGSLEKVYEDIQLISDTAVQNPELVAMLKSPVIKADTKLSILKSIFKTCSPLTIQFLEKVIDAKRENIMLEITHQFISFYNNIKGIAVASVTSAMPLGETSINKIKAYISEKINKSQINLTLKVDPKIIGGLVINYEDKLLDMSIKSELHKLKQSLN